MESQLGAKVHGALNLLIVRWAVLPPASLAMPGVQVNLLHLPLIRLQLKKLSVVIFVSFSRYRQ